MKIAIVEDEISCCTQLKTALKDWGIKHSIKINISCHKTGEELLSENFQYNQLIFLDISLPQISGMETANRLRQNGYSNHIIFVTSHNEYVYEGYHVRALDFILKPITTTKLENCMAPILYELKSSIYILRTATSIEKIPYASIISFVTQGHYIEIITKLKVYRQKISLKMLKQILPGDFVQCHRTVIVNVNHITKLHGKNLYLTNHMVYPISKQYMKTVQDSFINCSGQ